MATYGLTTITAPTSEPVSLEEAKRQCGISDEVNYHDDAIRRLISAARRKVESDTSRALINQTLELSLDNWPCGLDAIYIPRPPLSSVTSVKYYDTSNVEQTLSTTYYKVITAREPGEIRLKNQQSWPAYYGEASVITVRFVAGYGATYLSVPDGLREAMQLLIHHWFEPERPNPEDAYRALIEQYTVGDEFHVYAN